MLSAGHWRPIHATSNARPCTDFPISIGYRKTFGNSSAKVLKYFLVCVTERYDAHDPAGTRTLLLAKAGLGDSDIEIIHINKSHIANMLFLQTIACCCTATFTVHWNP